MPMFSSLTSITPRLYYENYLLYRLCLCEFKAFAVSVPSLASPKGGVGGGEQTVNAGAYWRGAPCPLPPPKIPQSHPDVTSSKVVFAHSFEFFRFSFKALRNGRWSRFFNLFRWNWLLRRWLWLFGGWFG